MTPTDEHLRLVAEYADEGYLLLDAERTVVDANPAARRLVGDGADPRGRPVSAPSPAIDALLDRLEPGGTGEVTTRGTGDERVVEVEAIPTADVGLDGTLLLLRDVTAREEREQQVGRYETLLETMPDAVVVADMDGRIVAVHGFEGWAGYDLSELVDGRIADVTTEEGIERARSVLQRLLSDDDRTKATFEQVVVTADGRRVPHEVHIALLPPDDDGRVPGTIALLRDIGERKAREADLRRKNERLDEFASVVSHDLRNPLNVAQGRVRRAIKSGEVDGLGSAEAALDRMRRLIDDLLTLSRRGTSIGETEPLDLSDAARAAWAAVEAPDAAFAVESDRGLVADRTRLVELLENLFRNAVEHGRPDVTLRVGAIDGDGFYVEDDGPGVPEDERDAVFEHGVTSASDGTGLGLTIVREIARAHGWSVAVVDGPEGGARFEFSGVETASA